MMTKTPALLALAATMTIGVVAAPMPADARSRCHGSPIAPIVGGLVADAALGAA